jgi:hypothetical protein
LVTMSYLVFVWDSCTVIAQAQGVRILDFACDIAMDSADKPLAVWSSIQVVVGTVYCHVGTDEHHTDAGAAGFALCCLYLQQRSHLRMIAE